MDSSLTRLRATCESVAQRFAHRPSVFLGYLTTAVLPEINEILETVRKRLLADLRHDNDTTRLTHYAALPTLLSLVERPNPERAGGSLRLYPTYRFNDPTEGRFLPRRIADATSYDWLDTAVREVAFAACFVGTSEGTPSDDLVYWRSYGHDGTGCSIMWTPQEPLPHLYRVGYAGSADAVTEVLRPILAAIEPVVYVRDPALNRKVRSLFGSTVWTALPEVRFLYKSDHYEHEQESRVLVTEADAGFDSTKVFHTLDPSSSGVEVRRYYVHDGLSTSAILRSGSVITLGPRVSNANDVRHYLHRVLGDMNLSAEIRISRVPYRAT